MSLRDAARQGDGRKWEYSQEGDEVGGTIVGRSTFQGDYEPAEMLTIEAEYIVEGGAEAPAETVKVLMGNTVLRGKVEELDPQPGDEIAIFFKGKVKPKSGGEEYSSFNVRVQKSSLRSAAQSGGDGQKADW